MDKKGLTTNTIVVILVVIIAGIVAVFLFFYFKGGAVNSFYDKVCLAGCGMRDTFTFFGVALISETCVAQHKDVIPDDWSMCNATFKEKEDVKGCLADQVAEIVRTCWVKRGGGDISCGDLRCYTVDIHNPIDSKYVKQDIEIAPDYFNNFLNAHSPWGSSKMYIEYLKPGIYYDGKLAPGELWTINYDEDFNFLIFGLDFLEKDSVSLTKVADLSES